jgi:hypothetical protein
MWDLNTMATLNLKAELESLQKQLHEEKEIRATIYLGYLNNHPQNEKEIQEFFCRVSSDVTKYLSEFNLGATLVLGTGVWNNYSEPSISITIICRDEETPRSLARWLKEIYAQYEVLLTFEKIKVVRV